MFIQVKLLNGFPEPLLYEVPADWQIANLQNAIVRVPLKNRIESALVVQQLAQKPPHITFTIKPALQLETFPADIHYQTFIQQLSRYYCTEQFHCIKRIRHFISQEAVELEQIASEHTSHTTADTILTPQQQAVCDFLAPAITQGIYTPTLLHGVTGSGKTEVYKRLILHTLSENKSIILMLPEVTLALQFEKLLRAQLPSWIPLFSFHSATSAKHKKQVWQMALEGKPVLVLGVHLPVLLPLANLGLIIVDEEHEIGYQEKKHPKINSKEAALMRAHIAGIPILLGSATPSIASLHNVATKKWHLFELTNRFAGNFPTIKTVLLDTKMQRRNFWISNELYAAMQDRLAKKEQTIVFLNRRGHSFFVQCKGCSHIFGCPSCSVSLTLHEDNHLNCHYCSFQQALPPACPACKKGEDQFIKKGIGTQQAVTILEKLFPQARIARADMDVTLKKKVWQQTMLDMSAGAIDILVGTQTITKGYHFPKVTLVGILWADLNLHFPMYNASETTLQQLIQVAGRAGRQSQESLVIVQTMADHPVFNYLNEKEYRSFYEHEMIKRTEVNYPPAVRFVEIEVRHENEAILEKDAERMVELGYEYIAQESLDVMLLGPAKPPVHKIKNLCSRKLYLKSAHMSQLIKVYGHLQRLRLSSSLFFTPNPLQ